MEIGRNLRSDGVGYGQQLAAFKAGAHLVIGTPGRILDHLLRRSLSLDQLAFLVRPSRWSAGWRGPVYPFADAKPRLSTLMEPLYRLHECWRSNVCNWRIQRT
jgi:hypothetical protein